MLNWICKRDTFTRQDFCKAFLKVSGAVASERLDGFVRAGVLVVESHGRGKSFRVVREEVHDK